MIVLVGFMGAGKSTVGRLVAERLRLPFVDADEVIARRAGRSIKEIFAAEGESGFRRLEREVVAELLEFEEGVIALGGGAVEDSTARTALGGSTVFHLCVGLESALARVGDVDERPMLKGSVAADLYERRRRLYEDVADFSIETEGRRPQEIARDVARLWRERASSKLGLECVEVEVPLAPYPVFVGSGASGKLADVLPPLPNAELAYLITHESLEPLAAPLIESLESRDLAVHVAVVVEGEEAKSLDAVGLLYDDLAARGLHRTDLVVGFGGGVVTDVAGFVASTYNRGTAVVHVPTTLLGQVDAAIGGKTGVNLAVGKNLVGTIHHPLAVLCDVALLQTLDEAELRSGLAEVVKYGLITSPELLDRIEASIPGVMERDEAVLTDVVATCASLKAAIVALDERDTSLRARLNYGHTFAHAIEQTSGYGTLRHGEAVALGMMAAAHLAAELGRSDQTVVARHREVLKTAGLPTTAELDLESLEKAWRLDKKYAGEVRFVLLDGIGRPAIGVTAPRAAQAKALERMAT